MPHGIAVLLFLLLHVVALPDHLPFSSQERTRDPTCLYPGLQEIEAWEPNDHPHDSEIIAPSIGGWRAGQDFPVDTNYVNCNLCDSRVSQAVLFTQSSSTRLRGRYYCERENQLADILTSTTSIAEDPGYIAITEFMIKIFLTLRA